MTANDFNNLLRRLAAHRRLSSAPAGEIQWLAERGTLHQFVPGAVVASASEPLRFLWVVLSGRLVLRRPGEDRKIMEWRAGDLSGVLPYSRMQMPPGFAVAVEPSDLFALPRTSFPALIRECPEITTSCVHAMLDRARNFKLADFQSEKMSALGRLAAGLAHELNNPASAVSRSASALPESLTSIDRAARELGAAQLTAAQLAAIDELHAFTAAHTTPEYRRPLDRADDQEALAHWLSDRQIDEEPADVLADVPEALAALERLEAVLDRSKLETVVEYIAAEFAARRLAAEIERAAGRISNLIAAVKRFTYMDQAVAPKPVDLVAGLKDTMLVLNAKARGKNVALGLDAPADLPAIDALGGELNQVWINLIENAIDAAPKNGHVTIAAHPVADGVIVSVVDNGAGISDAIRARIFDPFFTTKPVGVGTGLGLDIARRIVQRHGGEIEFTSTPGRTEFRVQLPLRRGDNLTT